ARRRRAALRPSLRRGGRRAGRRRRKPGQHQLGRRHGVRPRTTARESGFTLLEAVVVLILIALGSALVVPMVEGGLEAREVRRAARQIASTMHYCRGEAVALGQPQELVIDALANSIHTTAWGRWAVPTDRAVI